MKKLQLFKSDEMRPFTQFAQIKNGNVVCVTSYLILHLPTEDVFGCRVEGEWYMDRKMWGLLKFPSAKLISVEAPMVKNLYAGTELRLLSPAEYSATYGNYPDWESVVPARDKPLAACERIALNAELYKQVCDAWGLTTPPRINLYGPDRAMILDQRDQKGWALLMPVAISDDIESGFYNPAPAEANDLL